MQTDPTRPWLDEDRVPQELAAWARSHSNAKTALMACPYADWLLRLAEVVGLPRVWRLAAAAACVRELLDHEQPELVAAVTAVEGGAPANELMDLMTRVDALRTSSAATSKETYAAARAVQDLLHAALVPEDEGLTAALAESIACTLAEHVLLTRGLAAWCDARDMHRRALRACIHLPF